MAEAGSVTRPPTADSAGRASAVRLVLSDVDGTLVTPDKILTEATIAAARRLKAAGIALTITSSRPPRGLRAVAQALELTEPIAGFNGGRIVSPTGETLEERLLPPDAVARAVALIEEAGADVWLFAGDDWLLRNPAGAYVDRERLTVGFEPMVVDDFGPFCAHVGKIVGVSTDFALLERCEHTLKSALGSAVSASRSQLYYLDVTHPEATKGTVVGSLSRMLAIPPDAIAVIGDMENDMAMFAVGGLAIAMGNAAPDVQAAADFVTASNREEGWAAAMDRFILSGRKAVSD